MKIICIDNSNETWEHGLTIGKTYILDYIPLEGKENKMICIVNDNGVKRWYNKDYFKPLEDIREEKLNNLGI